MIMTVATAKVAVVVAVKTAMTAPMIGHLTDQNAVIQHGMNMELIALHLKVHMAGIVQVAAAPVMMAAVVVVTAQPAT